MPIGEANAREIIRLHLVEGHTTGQLAKRFRVSRNSIYCVLDGRSYPHLSRDAEDYPDEGDNMTAEELDRLIAEQYSTMPKRGTTAEEDHRADHVRGKDGPPKAVQVGRGIMARLSRRQLSEL